MPAALPEATLSQNLANPSQGRAVIFDALSGPKGSPFDKDGSGNASTGALSTGIGYGLSVGPINKFPFVTNAEAIRAAGFNDDGGEGTGFNSTAVYIGGGRSNADGSPNPYTSGFAPCGAGNGGSRDGGTGPAFKGFVHKMVTAVGTVLNGNVIETGFVNRTGKTLVADQSTFGSAVAAQSAPS
jgi:hypothetical protein